MYHYEEEQKFYEGNCDFAYSFLGNHKEKRNGKYGFVFRVWAPRAKSVSVVGDFNFWNITDLPMQKNAHGIWECFSIYAKEGQKYKYYIEKESGGFVYKNDPYAFAFAKLPLKDSLVGSFCNYKWRDGKYLEEKKKSNFIKMPVNIYECHLGSWERKEDGSFLTYEECAEKLVPYLKQTGYTHVELLPVCEYPYEPSWGYQVTGYFAPTSRYGTPDGLRKFIDKCHTNGIGVILDWVPAHFPKDEEGLFEYDGTPCYELADPMMNEHPDWNTRIFDYGRYEVRSFLISSALYWLREFHVDGLRVDAVASMLYLDYGRKEYKRNKFGGNYNLEAIEFLKLLNEKAFAYDGNVLMIAEESTAFPLVTKPGYDGGLGFNFKWNMGWMNDVLDYMQTDPLFRKGKHNELTFSLTYAFSENFILPFSHDEVVHGKKSLVDKMPGSYEEKFASYRLLESYRMAHPGKKLTFMGSEFAQFIEWDYKKRLDWFLLDYDTHSRFFEFSKKLNKFYLKKSQLWEIDSDWNGFRWISADDSSQSVISFLRYSDNGTPLLCIFNFCPVERKKYRLGLPENSVCKRCFSSCDEKFGGKDTSKKTVSSKKYGMHGFDFSGEFDIPPLCALFYDIYSKGEHIL